MGMIRKNIVLFMGGDSGEYDVSIGSAAQVNDNLDKQKFAVYPVLIRNGNWTYTASDGKVIPFDRNAHSLTVDNQTIKFDCAFIAIHGTPGEDGKLQGYLEMAGIPYTTCDVTTSAITFNKYFCNDLAVRYGAKVADTILLRTGQHYNIAEMVKITGLPCFVKPNKSGSSVGVTKVYKTEELPVAISKAFTEDDEVLVQQCITGREMACGVFSTDGKLHVLPVTEVVSKNDFFDYEAKYTDGMASEITPAPVTQAQSDECQRITADLYAKFNCRGVVRFDYFLCGDEWWFLEVNTVPGFSAGSIIPKQVRTAGLNLSDFYGSLIEEAIRQRNF